MAEYTVLAASQKKMVDGQHGPMQVIALTLQADGGQPQQCEWFTKATTNVPVAGQKLDGELQESQYGLKFKKTQGGGFGGFRGGGRSPGEQRSIARMHSQKMAMQYAAVKGEVPSTWTALEELVDWFYQDALNAQPPKPQPVRRDTQPDPSYPGTDVPADTRGLAA